MTKLSQSKVNLATPTFQDITRFKTVVSHKTVYVELYGRVHLFCPKI